MEKRQNVKMLAVFNQIQGTLVDWRTRMPLFKKDDNKHCKYYLSRVGGKIYVRILESRQCLNTWKV